jgi:hypothetical protein
VAQDVIREYRVKGLIAKKEILRSVTLLEVGSCCETERLREFIGIMNSGYIHIQAYNAATHILREM